MRCQPVDGLVAARASSPGHPEIGLKRHCNTLFPPGAIKVGASDCLKMRIYEICQARLLPLA